MREDLSPELQEKLGAVLRNSNYEIVPLLDTILLSKDFYSPASVGTQIKGPVLLAISTYRRLGLTQVPGVPDFTNARWQASRDDAALTRIIVEGRGAVMPPFRGTLSLEEAWAVGRYLRTFMPGTEVSRPEVGTPKVATPVP